MTIAPYESKTCYLIARAEHISPRFACNNGVFQVTGHTSPSGSFMWSASHPVYGCSKDYATPEQAVREMLLDHACTAIVITPGSEAAWNAQRAECLRTRLR